MDEYTDLAYPSLKRVGKYLVISLESCIKKNESFITIAKLYDI
jgi:hypothetical protein